MNEREMRDQIDADFKANKLGIENGWLFGYIDNPGHSCGPFGCPPECYMEPIVDLFAPSALDFIAFADASPATTWAGKLGLKERWLNRDNPEYQKMLRDQYGEKQAALDEVAQVAREAGSYDGDDF